MSVHLLKSHLHRRASCSGAATADDLQLNASSPVPVLTQAAGWWLYQQELCTLRQTADTEAFRMERVTQLQVLPELRTMRVVA